MTTIEQSRTSDGVIILGGMRNFHPLVGDKHYRKGPYAGWEVAKQVLTPDEVLPIFNAYLARNKWPPITGATWEEVEASARALKDGPFESVCFPELPDFYRLLASKTGKSIVIENYSMSDSAGEFHSITRTAYKPDGDTATTDLSPQDD